MRTIEPLISVTYEVGFVRRTVLHWIFSALFLCGMLQSQEPSQSWPKPDVTSEAFHVELRIGDGSRSTYHIGEIIKVSLIFSSSSHTQH
jgi:hypothetical protein